MQIRLLALTLSVCFGSFNAQVRGDEPVKYLEIEEKATTVETKMTIVELGEKSYREYCSGCPEISGSRLNLHLNSKQIEEFIVASKKRGDCELLSAPTISQFDGQRASIQIGQAYFTTGVSILLQADRVAVVPKIESFDTGIKLSVEPKVADDGKTISARFYYERKIIPECEIESFPFSFMVPASSLFQPNLCLFPPPWSRDSQPLVPSTIYLQQPKIVETDSTEFKARFEDGQTQVFYLGNHQVGKEKCKLPWLSEIPFMEDLFTWEKFNAERIHCIMIATMNVRNRPSEAEAKSSAGMTLPTGYYLQHPPLYFPQDTDSASSVKEIARCPATSVCQQPMCCPAKAASRIPQVPKECPEALEVVPPPQAVPAPPIAIAPPKMDTPQTASTPVLESDLKAAFTFWMALEGVSECPKLKIDRCGTKYNWTSPLERDSVVLTSFAAPMKAVRLPEPLVRESENRGPDGFLTVTNGACTLSPVVVECSATAGRNAEILQILLEQYEVACKAGNAAKARTIANYCLEMDPTCFAKKSELIPNRIQGVVISP